MQINDAFSKLSVQPAKTPQQAPVAKLPTQPPPSLNQVLLNFATCIEKKQPGFLEHCKKVKLHQSKIFLIPISERRDINLFTLAMVNDMGDFSEMVLGKLEEANLLRELVRQKDHAGWTPVHHAALVHKKIYKRLKKIPEVAGLKTFLSRSPSILRKIVRLSKNCLSDNDYQIYVRMPGTSVDILLPSSEAIQQKELFSEAPHHFTTISHMS